MTDKVLTVKSLVREAIQLRVLSKRNGIVYEGEAAIAQSEDELISQLSMDNKQMELLSLETRIADKKKMRSSIENFEYIAPEKAEPAKTSKENKK